MSKNDNVRPVSSIICQKGLVADISDYHHLGGYLHIALQLRGVFSFFFNM